MCQKFVSAKKIIFNSFFSLSVLVTNMTGIMLDEAKNKHMSLFCYLELLGP